MAADLRVHLCKRKNTATCHEAMSKADCTLHLLQSGSPLHLSQSKVMKGKWILEISISFFMVFKLASSRYTYLATQTNNVLSF